MSATKTKNVWSSVPFQISVLNLQLTFDLSFKVLPKLCNMLIVTLSTELKVKSSKKYLSIYNQIHEAQYTSCWGSIKTMFMV